VEEVTLVGQEDPVWEERLPDPAVRRFPTQDVEDRQARLRPLLCVSEAPLKRGDRFCSSCLASTRCLPCLMFELGETDLVQHKIEIKEAIIFRTPLEGCLMLSAQLQIE